MPEKKRVRRKYESFPEKLQRTYKAQGAAGRFAVQPKEFRFEYTTPGPYCKVDRLKNGRCATQLNFVEGRPVIRLCSKYGDPGEVIEVSSPTDAQEKARSFCNMRPEQDLSGLGQVEPARRPQRRPNGLGSPLWLMGGTALGLLASSLMRR